MEKKDERRQSTAQALEVPTKAQLQRGEGLSSMWRMSARARGKVRSSNREDDHNM